ncbi:MAG TPA: YheC/YheD family protein [Bacilli bacterium]
MVKGYKWARILILRRHANIARHIPETVLFSATNLQNMLEKHGDIIVKPNAGSCGIGVVRITESQDRYQLQRDNKVSTAENMEELANALRKRAGGRTLIIQERIPLAEVNERPIDARVMVQRKKGGDWSITGTLIKVAGPGFIVTNTRRSGGKVLPLATALRRSDVRNSAKSIQAKMEQLALATAWVLGRHYKKQRVFGIDMGIDKEGKVWLIETNFTPSVSLFRRLRDKSMYRRILRYLKPN